MFNSAPQRTKHFIAKVLKGYCHLQNLWTTYVFFFLTHVEKDVNIGKSVNFVTCMSCESFPLLYPIVIDQISQTVEAWHFLIGCHNAIIWLLNVTRHTFNQNQFSFQNWSQPPTQQSRIQVSIDHKTAKNHGRTCFPTLDTELQGGEGKKAACSWSN